MKKNRNVMMEKPLGSPSVPTHPICDTKVHFDQCSNAVGLGRSPAGPQGGQDNPKESHTDNNRHSTQTKRQTESRSDGQRGTGQGD